ncbi:MAG: YggT family protein [Alphaproteobacteria bacterium]
MGALIWLIDTAIQLFVWLLIAHVIISWLTAFNVINTRNPVVAQIGGFLYRITEPVLRPVRRFIPSLGGIDISPVIIILLLFFVRKLMWDNFGGTVMM